MPINGLNPLAIRSGRAPLPAGESGPGQFLPDEQPRQIPLYLVVHSEGTFRTVCGFVLLKSFLLAVDCRRCNVNVRSPNALLVLLPEQAHELPLERRALHFRHEVVKELPAELLHVVLLKGAGADPGTTLSEPSPRPPCSTILSAQSADQRYNFSSRSYSDGFCPF
jgi:hypothetical protein